jgi:RimJ/RimL family protein N-acetyltransferase
MRIVLREVHPADLEILFAYQREPAATEMAVFPARDRETFLDHWQQNVLGDPAVLVKIVEVDGRVAGWINSFLRGSQRLIGYWLGSRFWGRGIATHALEQFLKCETARPLFAHVARSNHASSRVLEKCGFAASREEVDAEGVEELVLKLE